MQSVTAKSKTSVYLSLHKFNPWGWGEGSLGKLPVDQAWKTNFRSLVPITSLLQCGSMIPKWRRQRWEMPAWWNGWVLGSVKNSVLKIRVEAAKETPDVSLQSPYAWEHMHPHAHTLKHIVTHMQLFLMVISKIILQAVLKYWINRCQP